MFVGKLVFSQVMDFMPMHTFRRCVTRYQGDFKVISFTCLDQYLCMAFAQITYRESLRDIEACLRAQNRKVYHMGIRGKVSKSTLSDANEQRDWRIYADLAQSLIVTARKLYRTETFLGELNETVYALDATTIDLCLSLFPWANFRQNKGAIKLHTLLDLRGNIPTFIHISDGKLHEVNTLDIIPVEPGAFYVMDRGYLDFARLYTLSQATAFFVTRAKSNLKYRRVYSHPVDRTTGLICDQTILFSGFYQTKDYPDKLRRVKYYDSENDKTLVFLTNNFTLPPLTIAKLYRCRWQVELFFKWIKQNLRIKTFYGTSKNAVKAQIWIAVSTYVLVAIMKKRLNIKASLYTILQILSVSIFEKTPILQLLTETEDKKETAENSKQLNLFT
ncbi:MAG: IS4 family transposase [Candidatus Saccharibacteria bacterium]|nr:IS4 family transposase [Candidatus Saccharibacteria bacterium]